MRKLICYVPNLRFPEFGKNYINLKLTDILIFQNGLNAKSEKYGKGVKYISVLDILNNRFITNALIKGQVDVTDEEFNTFKVEYGDILFQRSSESFEDIGRSNVYLDMKPSIFGGFVIRGKKNYDFNPPYLKYLLDSPIYRRKIIRKGAGAQHYNIGQDNLRVISIALPNTIIEQQKIAHFINIIDERIETQSKIIEEYKLHKKVIQNHIFNSVKNNHLSFLPEICTIKTGKLDANAKKEKGKYKFFTCAKDDYYTDTYSFSGPSLLISGNGDVGLIKYYNGKFNAYQRTYVLQNFKINPIYVKCIIEKVLPYTINKEKNIGAMTYIVLSTLSNLQIPITNSKSIDKISKLYCVLDEKITLEEKILKCYFNEKIYLLKNLFI